MTTFGFSG